MSGSEILHISFEENESQTVAVTQLARNVYRLEWTPIQDLELYLGDIIETQTQADGLLRFLRVLERASLRHYEWVVSHEFVNSVQFAEFGAAVEATGGTWEVMMGGWLLVHVPFESPFDAETELDRCISIAMNRPRGT